MRAPFRVVFITAPRGHGAQTLAKSLVAARLAACVNVVSGVVSHYRWQGKLRRDGECLLIAKTRASKMPALKRWIAGHHPYAVPELIAVPITAGSGSYLDWLAAQLS